MKYKIFKWVVILFMLSFAIFVISTIKGNIPEENCKFKVGDLVIHPASKTVGIVIDLYTTSKMCVYNVSTDINENQYVREPTIQLFNEKLGKE